MGASTTQKTLHQETIPKDWKLISSFNGISTFQHCISRDLCQLIRVNNVTPRQLQIYQARKSYSFVHNPQIYSFKIVDECTKQKYQNMKNNHNTVSFRIEDLNKRDHKNLDEKFFYRKFQQIILGYQYLFNRFGVFAINENQLGWTASFVTKVWVNENYAVNYANTSNADHKTEIKMVSELVHSFKKYCWAIDILEGKTFADGLDEWRKYTSYQTMNFPMQRPSNLNQTSYVYIPSVISNEKIQYINSSPKIERKCSYDLTSSYSSASNQVSSYRPIYTSYQTPRQVNQRNFEGRTLFPQTVQNNWNRVCQENFNPNISSLSQKNSNNDFSLKVIPYGQVMIECGKNYDLERLQASAHCSYMYNQPFQAIRPTFLNQPDLEQARMNHQKLITFNEQTKQFHHTKQQRYYTQNDQAMSGKFSIKFSTSHQSEKQFKNQHKDIESENQKFRLTQNSMNLSLKNHTISTTYNSRATFNENPSAKNKQFLVNRLGQSGGKFSQRYQTTMSNSESAAKIHGENRYTDRSSKPKRTFISEVEQQPIIQNKHEYKEQCKISFNEKIKQRQHQRVKKSLEKKMHGNKTNRNTKFLDQLKQKKSRKQTINDQNEDTIIRKMIQSASQEQLKKGMLYNDIHNIETSQRQSQSSLSNKLSIKLHKITVNQTNQFKRSENKKKSYSLHEEQKNTAKHNFGKKINEYFKDDFIEESQVQSQKNSLKQLDRISSYPVFIKQESMHDSEYKFSSGQENLVRQSNKKKVSIVTQQSLYKDSKQNSNQSNSENLQKDFNALFQSSQLNLQASSQYSFQDLRNQVVDLLNN